MVQIATAERRSDLIEMFLDATPRETYAYGRLATREKEDGTVELVAYQREILAEVNRGANDITLFTGHSHSRSPTVTDYLTLLGTLLNQRPGYSVNSLEGHAPTTGYDVVKGAAKYINEYIGDFNDADDLSPVEENAVKEVNRALKENLPNFFNEE